MTIKVFIATPVLNYNCSVNYTQSLLKTVELLIKNNIDYEVHYLNNLLTPLARNILTNTFMQGDCSHLFFIDSDITWKADDFLKILKGCDSVIGGAYPFKLYNMKKVDKTQMNENTKYKMIEYVCNTNGKVDIQHDHVEVLNTGTGFMCIARSVFDTLKEKVETFQRKDLLDDKVETIKNYFMCEIVNNSLLPEDFNFCRIARENNIKIYVDITVNLCHEGTYVFEGNLIETYFK